VVLKHQLMLSINALDEINRDRVCLSGPFELSLTTQQGSLNWHRYPGSASHEAISPLNNQQRSRDQ
jgi:hypothetical protein